MEKFYHIEITPKIPSPTHKSREHEFDLSFEELEQRFLTPYRQASPIVIDGRILELGDIVRIRIYETQQRVAKAGSERWKIMKDITKECIDEAPGAKLGAVAQPLQELRPAEDAREVFVVHGRNSAARDALFEFLRAIDLHPLEWSEAVRSTGKASPYVGDILDAAFSRAHAVIVLFTPDDEARLKEPFRADDDPPHETQLTGQARPNVLFESGMAMARDQDRTVLVELGTLRWFSDIGGRHTVRLDDTSQRRQDLAQRLAAAGCPVNLVGTDWHTAGDFETAIPQESSDPARIADQQVQIPEPSPLSGEAKVLLAEAAKDKMRMIHRIRSMGGTSITTNNQKLCERGNSRSEAKWEQAIKDLLLRGLIEDPNGSGQTFEVTHKGFQTADEIQKSQQ